MALASNSTSTVSRYKPAIAAIAILAACGIIYSVSTSTLAPAGSASLQRRGAVRRPPRGRIQTAGENHSNDADEGAADSLFVAEDADGQSVAPTELSVSDDSMADHGGQTLQRTLYHIAEERAQQEGVIHRNITCNGCDTKPIRGVRWSCRECRDYDLCSDCEATNSHIKTHTFIKMRIPAPYYVGAKQAVIYPGRPHLMPVSMNGVLKKRLAKETKMEPEEIDALYEQFTCLAATKWDDDPNNINYAIDRRAFNMTFIPQYSSFASAPNLIYDRIFDYYDTDRNKLIGLEEFIKGLDGLHSPSPERKMKIIFDGYDISNSGYISRRDVLRLFRAYYVIEKEATRNYVATMTEELSVAGALDIVRSSQPLGSAFTQHAIPGRRQAHPQLRGELAHTERDHDKENSQAVNDDDDDAYAREDAIALRSEDPDEQEAAVRVRWERRRFYIDEEDGMRRPGGFEYITVSSGSEDQPDMDGHARTPDGERTRWSRSSSRVRFQDDVDYETRSNASTSSRPFGERWGGYELPEPEKDVGKEILYEISLEGFNELLDPLFRPKEDMAMEAAATKAERRRLTTMLKKATDEFEHDEMFLKSVLCEDVYNYLRKFVALLQTRSEDLQNIISLSKRGKLGNVDAQARISEVICTAEEDMRKDSLKDTPDGWPQDWKPDRAELWNVKLMMIQFRHELETAFYDYLRPESSEGVFEGESLLADVRKNDNGSGVENDGSLRSKNNETKTSLDPTMPQFRPNSLADETNNRQTSPFTNGSDLPTTTQTRMSRPPPKISGVSRSAYHKGPLLVQLFSARDQDRDQKETFHFEPTSIPPEDAAARDTYINLGLHQEATDISVLFCVRIQEPMYQVEFGTAPIEWPDRGWQEQLFGKLRHLAMNNDSPMHLPFLASLEEAQNEIQERKCEGTLSFEEFKAIVKKEQRHKYLEAWLDWVSF